MNKMKYIDQLVEQLNQYDIKDKYALIADYEQIIDEILLDNQGDFNVVINKLGQPKELATELATEFGSQSSTKNKQTEKTARKMRRSRQYEQRRFKSNALWNILYGITRMIQGFMLLCLLFVTIISAQIGFRSFLQVTFAHENALPDQSFVSVVVCQANNVCSGYRIKISDDYSKYYYNDFQNDHQYRHYKDYEKYFSYAKRCYGDGACSNLYDEIVIDHLFTISVMTVVIAKLIVTLIVVGLLQLLSINPIRKVKRKNNEYNRRRYYD